MSDVTQQPLYLILFDDIEVPAETMHGADVARRRFEQISGSWNAHLFVKVASNSRDDRCAASNAKLATDFDAEHALRLEAERQVEELRLQLAHMERLRNGWRSESDEHSKLLHQAMGLLRKVAHPKDCDDRWFDYVKEAQAFLNTTSTEGKDHE